jgi:hypothetical protein
MLRSLLSTVAVGVFCMASTAQAYVNAGYPTGSCCSSSGCVTKDNPNGEGASHMVGDHWSCGCDASTMARAGNPYVNVNGQPLSTSIGP